MTEAELHDLMDLSVDGLLPEALQARLTQYLSDHPDAAEDYKTLKLTVSRLKAHACEKPDTWFTERALSSLLRDTAESEPFFMSRRTA